MGMTFKLSVCNLQVLSNLAVEGDGPINWVTKVVCQPLGRFIKCIENGTAG